MRRRGLAQLRAIMAKLKGKGRGSNVTREDERSASQSRGMDYLKSVGASRGYMASMQRRSQSFDPLKGPRHTPVTKKSSAKRKLRMKVMGLRSEGG